MDEKIRTKIRKALTDEALSIHQLSRVLTFRTKKNLQKFIDTINQMYSDDELLLISENQEKYFMLVRK